MNNYSNSETGAKCVFADTSQIARLVVADNSVMINNPPARATIVLCPALKHCWSLIRERCVRRTACTTKSHNDGPH